MAHAFDANQSVLIHPTPERESINASVNAIQMPAVGEQDGRFIKLTGS